MPEVLVPASRWPRWLENFRAGHGETRLAVAGGALTGHAADGSTFTVRLPFGRDLVGTADPADAAAPPPAWGVLLVRKGGFAVARLAGDRLVALKVGRRHVQGRTKAGGQSQQRFARRRDQQARQAYEAATGHAVAVLGDREMPVVTGGDRGAVAAVLEERRLAGLTVVPPWLPVPDPRRAVLDAAVRDAAALRVDVVNA